MVKKIIYIDNFLAAHGKTPSTGHTMVALLRNAGFTVVAASNRLNKTVRLLHMLAAIFINRKNAVVLIATYSTGAFYFAVACATCCRFLKLPYIACLHGGNLPARIRQSPRLSQQLFGKSFMNVAVSGYLQAALTANNWPCTVIPNSIDLSAYPFRQRNSCGTKLLWVRSFHKIYNPQMAIEVLKYLNQDFPGATLTMAGPDKDGSMEQCRQMAAACNLQQQVHFTGLLPRDAWVKLAAAHDVFINTSNFDNLPVSIIEAMALGMVVISTDAGGIPYLVSNQVNGLLTPAGDATAMVNAIKMVIGNPEMAQQLSLQARLAAAAFNAENIILKWRNLLAGIA